MHGAPPNPTDVSLVAVQTFHFTWNVVNNGIELLNVVDVEIPGQGGTSTRLV